MAAFIDPLDPDAILGQLDPHPDWYNQKPPGNLIDPTTGLEVYDTKGDKKREFNSLPLELPDKIHPVAREVLFRKHKHMTYLDIWARQPPGTPLPNKNALNQERLRKARVPYNSRCWTQKYTGRPTKVMVLFVETLTEEGIKKNTGWSITDNGIVNPKNPQVVLPLDYFLINGAEHVPSDEVRDALAESKRLKALAEANGKTHWSELSRELLPRAWSARHKDGQAGAEDEIANTGRLETRGTNEELEKLEEQLPAPVSKPQGRKRRLEGEPSEEADGSSKRAKYMMPQVMNPTSRSIKASVPQSAEVELGYGQHHYTSHPGSLYDPPENLQAPRYLPVGDHVCTNCATGVGQTQGTGPVQGNNHLKRKRFLEPEGQASSELQDKKRACLSSNVDSAQGSFSNSSRSSSIQPRKFLSRVGTTPYFAKPLSTSHIHGAQARGSAFQGELGLYAGDDLNDLSQDTRYIPAQILENVSSTAFHHSPTAFNGGLDRTNYISQPQHFKSPRMGRGSATNVEYRAGEVAAKSHGPNNISMAGAEDFSGFLNQGNSTRAAGVSSYGLGNTRVSRTNNINPEVPHPSAGLADIWATQMPKPEDPDLVPFTINTGTHGSSQATTGAFDTGAHGAILHNNSLFNAELHTRIANAKERNARSRNARVQIANIHLSSARHARANASDVPATALNVTAAYNAGHPRTTHPPPAAQFDMLPHTPLGSSNNPIVLSPEQDTIDDFLGAGQHDASGWNFNIFEDPPTKVTAPPIQGFFDLYEDSPAEVAATSTDDRFETSTGNETSGALSVSTTPSAPTDENLTHQTREQPTADHSSPSVSSLSDALLWVPEGNMLPTDTIVTASAPTVESIIRDIEDYLTSNTHSQALPDPSNNLTRGQGVSEHPNPASTPPVSQDSVNHAQTQSNPNYLHAALPTSSNGLAGIQNTSQVPASTAIAPSTSELQVDHPQELYFPENPVRDFSDLFSDGTTNIYDENLTATISPSPNRHPAIFDSSLAPAVPNQSATDFYDHFPNDPPLFDRTLATPSPFSAEPTVDFDSFFRTYEDEDPDAWWFGNTTLPL
ncbi:MAG: hypothetical protein Q9187_007355 [Circinaria calcarea]